MANGLEERLGFLGFRRVESWKSEEGGSGGIHEGTTFEAGKAVI
jgi:hypothetical protein